MKAKKSGIVLSKKDAAVIKGMIARGDRQHDIAAWFGVNGGRIGEISTGEKFSEIEAQNDKLPPVGPYVAIKSIFETKEKLVEILNSLSKINKDIDAQIKKLSEGGD